MTPEELMRVSTRLARPAEFEALRWNGVEADRPAVIKAAARVGIADHPLAVERDDPDVDLASASPAHLRETRPIPSRSTEDAVGLGRWAAGDAAPDEPSPVEPVRRMDAPSSAKVV